MKILFDQGTPVPLRKLLHDHSIITAYELGWQTLENGDLIAPPKLMALTLSSQPIKT
ncbi:MAG: hypothetical protein ACT4O9_08815 [Blastocatellia bacterium]